MAKMIHWLVPATMLGSLVAGVFFAVGHHYFYFSLAGHEAPLGDYHLGMFTYSKQEANIQIGTALAFLAKAALAVAIVTAYVQLFWHTTLHLGVEHGLPLGHLDVSFSVTDNIISLFRLDVWLKRPFSMLLALVAW